MLSFCKVLGTAVGVAIVGTAVVFMGMCTYLTIGAAYYRILALGTNAPEMADELFSEAEVGFKLARTRRKSMN